MSRIQVNSPKVGDIILFEGQEYLVAPTATYCEGCLLNSGNGKCRQFGSTESVRYDCIANDVIFIHNNGGISESTPIKPKKGQGSYIPGPDLFAVDNARLEARQERIKRLHQAKELGAVILLLTSAGWQQHNITFWSTYCKFKLEELNKQPPGVEDKLRFFFTPSQLADLILPEAE